MEHKTRNTAGSSQVRANHAHVYNDDHDYDGDADLDFYSFGYGPESGKAGNQHNKRYYDGRNVGSDYEFVVRVIFCHILI